MASSSAVLSPPAPKPADSDVSDADVDMEYEEIEVEEVVEEVEEEVEAEGLEEGDDDEFGEDLTPVREENKENDTNQLMELQDHGELIQPGPVAKEISVSKPISGERTSGDNDQQAPFCEGGEVNYVERTPFIQDVNGALIKGDASREKDNAILSVMAETSHTAVEAVDNIGQISPRLHVQQIRFRHPSSSAEYGRENKKLMIACEFHAKGWCIKGNSCRFLHIKDGLDAAVKKSEVLGREAFSSARILPQQIGENPKLNSETEKLVLHENDVSQSAPLRTGKRSFGHNLYLDRYSYNAAPLVKVSSTKGDGTYRGNFSGSSVTSHDNHQNTRMTAFGTTSEEMNNKKSDILHNDLMSADLPYSLSRQPLSFGSSSWNTAAVGIHNVLQSGQEHGASGSESENLRQNHTFRNTGPAKYKTKLTSYDWEPSAPFRPSHAITRNLLLKESLYDPIRDSIERTDVGDGKVKFSYSDQGSSVKNVKVQSKGSQEEEKLLNSFHVGDTVEENILSSSCDNKLKFDKPGHKTELKVEGSSTNDETGADFKKDGHMQTDSKAFKYFQAALIEFVKELVRPTWQKGLLSKDAHKVIVKKAVDKVLSTFQPNQIPNTGESVKLYLSTSEPKLAKLVEAYIIKYGKS